MQTYTHKFRNTHARGGMTLIEIVVATALMMVIMLFVVRIFGTVSSEINKSRAGLEMASSLRATAARLEGDLTQLTVEMIPPRSPGDGDGYFEYVEGPIGLPGNYAGNDTTIPGSPTEDATVGDIDDVLMFTVRNTKTPFLGMLNGQPIESDEAEIAWFVRGNVLYRRVLPIVSKEDFDLAYSSGHNGQGFYADNDASVRMTGWDDATKTFTANGLAANTLADLTKRENRFAHDPSPMMFPNSPYVNTEWLKVGLPTLGECSFDNGTFSWQAGASLEDNLSGFSLAPGIDPFDAWLNPYPWDATGNYSLDSTTGNIIDSSGTKLDGPRAGEDVILRNVLSFDVKAWDPTAPIVDSGAGIALQPGDPGYDVSFSQVDEGAYVDLNYLGSGVSVFSGPGDPRSGLDSNGITPAIYDTWSKHYESDGLDQFGDGQTDLGTNGFDDPIGGSSNGVVDDESEYETQPPYNVPLRGIQVKIRVFDPSSGQIREMTVIRDFLPE